MKAKKIKNKKKVNKRILKRILVVLLILLVLTGVSLFVINIIKAKENKQKDIYRSNISSYIGYLSGYNVDAITQKTENNKSYIAMEGDVENEKVSDLISSILATVSIKFKYNEKGKELIGEETEVVFSFVSYEAVLRGIETNKSTFISNLNRIKTGTPKDREILYDKCIEYIANEIANTTDRKEISIKLKLVRSENKNWYLISSENDKALDSILFSNEELYSIYDLFSELAGYSNLIQHEILGTYNRETNNIELASGSGIFEDMASIGKDIETIYLTTKNKRDIYVRIDRIYTGQDAIKLANDLHEDNRGVSTEATTQMLIVEYTVTNLTDKKFTVKNRLALSDSLGNLSSSSGKLFGFTESGKIEPYGELKLQWYTFNEDIKSKYLVWGSNFKKEYPYVWFNCLQRIKEE